jgi:plastocyanin
MNRILTLAFSCLIIAALSVPVTAQRGRKAGEMVTVDTATAAKIQGTVTLRGEAPRNRPIRMDADPVCASGHEGLVFDEMVVVDEDGNLKDAFVFIAKGLEGKSFPMPEENAVLDQVGCIYVPPVWGMQVGQELTIKNSDATLHNVHAINKSADVFNLAMPTKDMVITQKFREEAVMVKVKCDVHPWMFAYVGVLNHPYHAVSAEDGTFEIENVPPGKYTVGVWHRAFGMRSAEIELGEKEFVDLKFRYSAK